MKVSSGTSQERTFRSVITQGNCLHSVFWNKLEKKKLNLKSFVNIIYILEKKLWNLETKHFIFQNFFVFFLAKFFFSFFFPSSFILEKTTHMKVPQQNLNLHSSSARLSNPINLLYVVFHSHIDVRSEIIKINKCK